MTSLSNSTIKTSSGILKTGSNLGFIGGLEFVKKGIEGALSQEGYREYKEKGETFQELLNDLEDEVERVSLEIGYYYEGELWEANNYYKRLGLCDEILLRKIDELFLNYPRFKFIYESLLKQVPETSRESLRLMIYHDYLMDLAYESIDFDEKSMKVQEITPGDFHKSLDYFESLEGVKIGNFSNSVIIGRDIPKETFIFGKFNFIGLNLDIKGLSELDISQLTHIFRNKRELKFLGFSQFAGMGSISDFDERKLEIIFSNLNSLRYLNLNNQNLGELSKKHLKIVFGNLAGLKSLSLFGCSFDGVSFEDLKVIFNNLRGLRVLDLKRTENISSKEIEFIKSLLPNTKVLY